MRNILQGILQLSQNYNIKYAEFVDEIVLQAPSFLVSTPFFLHATGLATRMSAQQISQLTSYKPLKSGRGKNMKAEEWDINIISNNPQRKENIDLSNDNIMFNILGNYNNDKYFNIDFTIHSLDGSISIFNGLDSISHLSVIWYRGILMEWLKKLNRNTIPLSMIQSHFHAFYQTKIWTCNLCNQLRKLDCNITADGKGDFIVSIAHLVNTILSFFCFFLFLAKFGTCVVFFVFVDWFSPRFWV